MAQFARPDADNSIGSWTDDASGTTNIYQAIDETSASDTDYIRSEDNPATSVCNFTLSDVSDPAVSTGHVVRYRYRKQESGADNQINLTVRLREGVTSRASQSHTNISTSWTDGSFTLSGAEADAIIDYADLVLEFEADKPSGADTAHAEVSWGEFEVPDSGGNLRASQVFANYLSDNNPELRVSQSFANYLADNDPELRASQVFANYLSDNNPELRASQVFANVAETPRVFWFVPDEDVSTGSWTTGATDLWENLVYDDASYITSSLNPTLGDAFEVYIRNFVWPETDYRVWLELRMSKVDSLNATQTDGNEIDVLVELINDSTVIWSWNLNNVNGDTGLIILEADAGNPGSTPVTPTEFSVKITATSDGVGSSRAIQLNYLAAKTESDNAFANITTGGGGSWFCCCGTSRPPVPGDPPPSPGPGPGECTPCVCGFPTDFDITITGVADEAGGDCSNCNALNVSTNYGIVDSSGFAGPCTWCGGSADIDTDCLPFGLPEYFWKISLCIDFNSGTVWLTIWNSSESNPYSPGMDDFRCTWVGHLNPSGDFWDCANFDHTDLTQTSPGLIGCECSSASITNLSINCTP